MAEPEPFFEYVAIDGAGKRVKGVLAAPSDTSAFARLKRDGLSPVSIRPGRKKGPAQAVGALSDREIAALLSDLAALLRAGSDIRSSLSVIGARADRAALQSACRKLSADIGGGGALDQAFAAVIPTKHGFIPALVAAGEASGDLAGGLRRAADILEARLKIREQLISVLSYPAFVLVSTVFALGIILLMVVPSLAPLAQAPGAEPSLAMRILLSTSDFLRANLVVLAAGGAMGAISLAWAARAGLFGSTVDALLLDGPLRRTVRGLVYGGFAIALGNVLSAGAPMSEALRLATRSVRSGLARSRLEPVAQAVRQGEALSSALDRVAGFPGAVTRLASIGEASGALGPMLSRAGTLEEEAAVRRIEATGRFLGPALIIGLGGLIGLLMAGLLSGVSGLGEAALN